MLKWAISNGCPYKVEHDDNRDEEAYEIEEGELDYEPVELDTDEIDIDYNEWAFQNGCRENVPVTQACGRPLHPPEQDDEEEQDDVEQEHEEEQKDEME
eukprot:gene24051-30349_t